MTVAAGDPLPDIELRTMTDDGPQVVRSGELFGTGRSVLFAVPGAFTPGCSNHHLPSFVGRAEELAGHGVDRVACVGVNDVFVMDAWGRAHGADDIVMLADGNADFTRAMGLEADFGNFGMGTRSRRYAAIIDDGVVTHLAVDPSGVIEASTCDGILEHL